MNTLTPRDLQDLKFLESKQALQEMPKMKSETRELIEILVEDDKAKLGVPKDISEKFWVFFDKELALSNLEKADVQQILHISNILRIDSLLEQPDYKINFDDIKHLDMIQLKAFIKAKRSTGGLGRERGLVATQIRQIWTPEMQRPSGGIMSKIGGIFKRRGR